MHCRCRRQSSALIPGGEAVLNATARFLFDSFPFFLNTCFCSRLHQCPTPQASQERAAVQIMKPGHRSGPLAGC